MVEIHCEKYALLTKHNSYVFKSTRDSEFIDADLCGDNVTTVYSRNRKFGEMQLYYITTNKHNTYTVQSKRKYDYIDQSEIFVINKKYILRNSYALIIGDEFGFITLENIDYVTDNFIVSSTDMLFGRNPICKVVMGGWYSPQYVYLLDLFTGGATGKKTKPAPRDL